MVSGNPTIGDLSGLPAALLERRRAAATQEVPPPGLAGLVAPPPPVQEAGLPPGVERLPNGQLIRRLVIPTTGGSSREQIRFVASTLEEAREKHWDYYHPTLGWVREGYKLEVDRKPQDIMADASSAVPDPSLFPTKR